MLSAVFGVVVYRLTLMGVMSSSEQTLISRNAKLFTSVTAAGINLVVILIMDRVSQPFLSEVVTNIFSIPKKE